MAEKSKKNLVNPIKSFLSKTPLTVFLWAVIIILFSILSDKFLTISNMMNIIVQVASGVGIIAIGSFMAICSTGVDLSMGGTMAFASMMVGRILVMDVPFFNTMRDSNPILLIFIAILCAIIVGLSVGAFNGWILSKTKIPAFIITLATFKIGETMARILGAGSSIQLKNDMFRFIGGGSLYSIQVGRRTVGLLPIAMLVMIPMYIIFQVIMKHTRFGTYVYAIGGNNEASVLSGVNVDRTRFTVFLLNGFLAAIAGILMTSRLASSIASTGLGMEFDGIAAAVVGGASMKGGKSSPLRTLIGAFMIGALRNGLNMMGMQNSFQMMTIGAVMMAIVMIDTARENAN